MCAVLVYDPKLIDHFLHSRFLATSIFLLTFSAICFWFYRKGPVKLSWLDISVILFCSWNLVSLGWAEHLAEGLFAAEKWILFSGGYFIIRVIFRQDIETVISYLPKVSRIATLYILLIITYELATLLADGSYNNTSLYELQRLFGHRSLIAGFLMLLIPLNLLDVKVRGALFTPISALIGWQVVVIIMLQSRAVYLGLFVMLAIIGMYSWRKRNEWLSPALSRQVVSVMSLMILGVVIILITNPSLRDRVNPLNYATAQTGYERRLIWIKSANMVKDHPIIGVGSGNWKMLFPGYGLEGSYRMQDQQVVFTRVHNDFLEILVELGGIGLLIYIAVFLVAWYRLWRSSDKPTWQQLMVGSGLASFAVVSLIDFPKERIEFILLLALYLALTDLLTKRTSGFRFGINKGIILGVLGAALCFIGWTGLARYHGELKTKEMLKARASQQWEKVILLSREAQSRWYNVDHATTPLLFYSGIAQYHLGDLDQAEEDFRRGLAIHPHHFQLHNNLSTVLLQKKNFSEAIVHLEEALRINDRFEDALFNLAFCYYSMKDFEQAKQVVQRIPTDSEKKQAFTQEITKALQDNPD
ncbi:MAG: tetratricopeptide repeat protein [Saprospiraceae bacterium]|nr:tetratricopeptide repeat protein [Saprospiraceae bacterium]